ncbi:universal stress family protein [Cystoisospora suis]|uniref:Universal stress family protein n=1 Tax=Cystoisospora suis TaxID=483139 RepID=A0A2C6JUG6_9APIC|nr:universal stress family protein [Cystoisospora suis]
MYSAGLTPASIVPVDGFPGASPSSAACPLCSSAVTPVSKTNHQRSPFRSLPLLASPRVLLPSDFLLPPAATAVPSGSSFFHKNGLLGDGQKAQDGGGYCSCSGSFKAEHEGDKQVCVACGDVVPPGTRQESCLLFQESVTCIASSGRSMDLLIWGVRKLIERDFPCLYTSSALDFSRGTDDQRLDRSIADSENCCSSQNLCVSGIDQDQLLPSTTHQTPSHGPVGVASPAVVPGCGCALSGSGVTCEGRQVVVVSVEGIRQRDQKVLKWVRNNVLKSGDVVVLVTAWERAEEPKFLKVPARVNKTSVGNLLCRCSAELEASVLVVGSHGHTSLRQVLCGSVSRHVRAHATCKVVMPKMNDVSTATSFGF